MRSSDIRNTMTTPTKLPEHHDGFSAGDIALLKHCCVRYFVSATLCLEFDVVSAHGSCAAF